MTIKKPMKAPKPSSESAETVPSSGSAVLADRFKLDLQDPNSKRGSAGPATTVAAVAGLIALAVAGILTFVIYQHWEALKGA